jgi:hypothetical protein
LQAARVAKVLTAAWTGVDPSAIDQSMRRVLPQAAIAITGGQGRAAELSYIYMRRFIAAELGLEVAAIELPRFNVSDVAGRTLLGNSVPEAVGFEPIFAKRAIARGASAEEAVAMALRHLQTTGRSELYRVAREEVMSVSRATTYIDRYQRIASPTACKFCRMLAGRGPVYRLETVGFRSHGNCGCTAEPVVQETTRPSLRAVS